MLCLSIDTSSMNGVVLLAKDGQIISTAQSDLNTHHSEKLLQHIHKVLSEAGQTLADLSHLGLGLGPGSFTGLRIGFSTMRTLSQVLNIPMITAPTLLAQLLSGFPEFQSTPNRLISTAKAFRGEFFLLDIPKNTPFENLFNSSHESTAVNAKTWAREIQNTNESDTIEVFGPGALSYESTILEEWGHEIPSTI